jgi:hypothetical protein
MKSELKLGDVTYVFNSCDVWNTEKGQTIQFLSLRRYKPDKFAKGKVKSQILSVSLNVKKEFLEWMERNCVESLKSE